MKPPRALVVGGTGPTGPLVVASLKERGYDVAVLHRGVHETAELVDVEHIHADPHFEETLAEGLIGREFELVVGMYGRTRLVAAAVAGRCDRFVGIGGTTVYEGAADPGERHPSGMRILADEGSPLASTPEGMAPSSAFVQKMIQTEESVFDLHERGAFSATWLRYSMVYGPRTLVPWEWSVIRRVLDGRRYIILPDDGLSVRSRLSAINAGAMVMLVIDNPGASVGEIFNCADEEQFSLRQWVEIVSRAAGRDLEVVSLPWRFAQPAIPLFPYRGTGSLHRLVDIRKARTLLGYEDAVRPEVALTETTDWYLENRPTPETHPNFADTFDYEWEDAIVSAYERAAEAIDPLTKAQHDAGVMHDYPHPKAPGANDELGR